LAKSLGVVDATVEALRADIRKNLEREVKYRVLGRNKQALPILQMPFHIELGYPLMVNTNLLVMEDPLD
jgi:hypothetical protein